MSNQHIRAEINKYLDPKDKGKKLANDLTKAMFKAASKENLAFAHGPAIAAIAVLCSQPDITKKNAITLAKNFGKFVADEIEENWPDLVEIHKKAVAIFE